MMSLNSKGLYTYNTSTYLGHSDECCCMYMEHLTDGVNITNVHGVTPHNEHTKEEFLNLSYH